MATSGATKKRTASDARNAERVRATRRRSPKKVNPHRGPSLASFLREEGIYEEAAARAIKEVLVFQIQAAMERLAITKADMARRMATSRAALDRLLDPQNQSVTLGTLFRAASALGADLRVELSVQGGATTRAKRRGTRG